MNDAAEDLDTADDTDIENTASAWPEDWRQQIVGDDEKMLEHIGKYATPKDLWTKARSLEQQLSSGEYKRVSAFPEKGSDEEKAAWRSSNNIPEAADKYEISREMEKEEREQIGDFLEYAHNNNMSGDQVNQMVDWFYQRLETDETTATEGDKAAQQQTEDELRVEWGGDYRGHMNRIEALVDMVPGGKGDSFLDARMPDGTKLRANPDVMKFLLNSAISINPATTIVPADGDVMSGIQDEIDQIRELMRKDRKKYNGDEKMQARYRELLTAQEKAGKLK